MLIQSNLVPFCQLVWYYLLNPHSVLPRQQIILAVPPIIHIMGSNVPSYFVVLVPVFEFVTFRIFVVGEIDGVIC